MATSAKVQFSRDVLPVLSANCFACHGPDEKNRKAGLRLDVAQAATRTLKSGSRAIVPRKPEESELVARIFATDNDRMPPPKSRKELKETEKHRLKRWIAEGAAYQRHWAFTVPSRPPVPVPRREGWARNPIDCFILARLEAEGLQPSPVADRYTLARRVSLDLTGLPPTLEAVDRFVSDPRPDAYEHFVDDVLASPAYGERWAEVWLDLARYADSNGYANDLPRTVWKYRDGVIQAINRNLPFDAFTIQQIAGDLLPPPTLARSVSERDASLTHRTSVAAQDQVLATAFHRNTLTNDEGGTSREEFRVAAVVDRVNTTMQVWMGLTMACAQCHDHKYDPITQEEYYRFFAIFNQTEDADRSDNSPLLTTGTPADLATKARLETEIAALEKAKGKREQVAKLRKEVAALPIVTTPIMRELPKKQKRTTRIHIRGNFLNEGKEVIPGVPALSAPLPKDQPPNRLALARWLVDPANPLTARVTVNRYWEQVFGVGLVETPEDFGIRGKPPTHPELLDWLATEFCKPCSSDLSAKAWDVKRLLRLLVTSATYRQSARITAALEERDPDNRLFARGPRFRSSAEVIRDQALFAAGLLSPKMFGPPVRPPQPRQGLTAAFGSLTDWTDSSGDDKYRRALYTQWRRTTPYPSMVTFDAPSRNFCTVRRPRTNTPLQALVTLNDPCYVEAAQALGRRIARASGVTVEDKVRYGFRLCLTRPPRAEETQRLAVLYWRAREEFAAHPKDAEEAAAVPLGPVPAGMDTVDLAAWTVVSNVLLNLDETFTKR